MLRVGTRRLGRACNASITWKYTRRFQSAPQPKAGDAVTIAMSGGVDSSVIARLLVEKDYDLRAVFMRNWDIRDEKASDTGCEWERDWEDVQRVCRQLDIPCEMVCSVILRS